MTSDNKSKKVQVPLVDVALLLSKGNTLANLANVSDEQMESLYALAYQYYNAQNYADALKIFKILAIYDSADERFFMGIASCEQGLGNYESAADFYSLACALGGLIDPKPMYYCAICLLKVNQKDRAKVALESTTIMGREGNKSDAEFKEKSTELLKIISENSPK